MYNFQINCIYSFPYANVSIKRVTRGKIHYSVVPLAAAPVVVVRVKVSAAAIPSAALSSLPHLPTYNTHNHPIYFHINKAQQFKMGKFHVDAG